MNQNFLLEHPYCQVWLAEHGISEETAIREGGLLRLHPLPAPLVAIPLSTEIHHKNKRRGFNLLDQSHWLAVSGEAHRRIEANKAWARARGFLENF